jgi:hypothetical protein|tara:strand:+ start:343 stop:699 length:357 start_codon:yes stop_codon:yes gene_type:complete
MDNQTIEKYKYDHIESHLNYWLDNNNMTFEQAYEKYEEEIHDIVFNTDYFIIGYYQAEQWLIKDDTNYTFEVLSYVQEQEEINFGTIEKIDNAERLVNLYAYWLGYEIVQDYIDKLKQ